MLAAVTQNDLALHYASEELKRDKKIVLAAVTQYGSALLYASKELRRDEKIVLAAVTQYGRALQFASEELRRDKKIVIAAVTQNGQALQLASEELRRDEKIVLAAVTQDGLALQYASEELKRDEKIVLAAVTQDGLALEFASEELKGDKELMLAAVTQSYSALQYASEELKRDEEFLLDAYIQNKYVIYDIPIDAYIQNKYVIYPKETLNRLKDYDFIINKMKTNLDVLKRVEGLNDKEFALQLIASDPRVLQYVNYDFLYDKDFVSGAIQAHPDSAEIIKKEIEKDWLLTTEYGDSSIQSSNKNLITKKIDTKSKDKGKSAMIEREQGQEMETGIAIPLSQVPERWQARASILSFLELLHK
jgi:hypothetical protein